MSASSTCLPTSRRRVRTRASVATTGLVLAFAAPACSTAEPTGILVGLSSQLPLRTLVVRVENDRGDLAHCQAYDVGSGDPGAIPLPATLGVEPADDDAASHGVRVRVTAYTGIPARDPCARERDSDALVRAEAVTAYSHGQVLDLPMPITLSCVGVPCEGETTCRFGKCQPVIVGADGLARVDRDGAGSVACQDLSSCSEAVVLAPDGACRFAFPGNSTVPSGPFLPFVVHEVDPASGRREEFLDRLDYDLVADGKTTGIRLSDGLCNLVASGVIGKVAVAFPCGPLDGRTVCAGSAPDVRRIVDAVDGPVDAGVDATGPSADAPGPDVDASPPPTDGGTDATIPDGDTTDGTDDPVDVPTVDATAVGDALPIDAEVRDAFSLDGLVLFDSSRPDGGSVGPGSAGDCTGIGTCCGICDDAGDCVEDVYAASVDEATFTSWAGPRIAATQDDTFGLAVDGLSYFRLHHGDPSLSWTSLPSAMNAMAVDPRVRAFLGRATGTTGDTNVWFESDTGNGLVVVPPLVAPFLAIVEGRPVVLRQPIASVDEWTLERAGSGQVLEELGRIVLPRSGLAPVAMTHDAKWIFVAFEGPSNVAGVTIRYDVATRQVFAFPDVGRPGERVEAMALGGGALFVATRSPTTGLLSFTRRDPADASSAGRTDIGAATTGVVSPMAWTRAASRPRPAEALLYIEGSTGWVRSLRTDVGGLPTFAEATTRNLGRSLAAAGECAAWTDWHDDAGARVRTIRLRLEGTL
ncbi:MAG: hypothetical protein U0169_02510 [Polyangiaceae bacterium]